MGDTTILDLKGDVTFGEGNTALRDAIRRGIAGGARNFILNFAGVVYIDSSGVGELVSGFIAVNREGGRLRLINLPSRTRELLAICKLLSVFDVCEAEADAAGIYA
jgi:anti-sigma B factor antagonist